MSKVNSLMHSGAAVVWHMQQDRVAYQSLCNISRCLVVVLGLLCDFPELLRHGSILQCDAT